MMYCYYFKKLYPSCFICRKLNQQPSIRVHINFMVSLLCLYIVFLIGIDMTHLPDGCITIAILLHYFSLSTVFLMGAEAVTMYFLFVSVTGQTGGIKQIPYYVLRVAMVAWGKYKAYTLTYLPTHNDHCAS